MVIFKTPSWNNKTRLKIQCIREKTGAEDIVKEINQYQENGYNTYRGWTQTEYLNKHYNINQKDEDT
jgi:hypothetical protein